MEISCVIASMATGALEHRVVIRIGMARRAHVVCIAVAGRERCVLRVIKARVEPVRGAVTGLTSRREELRLRRVSRVCRVVVIRLMAANAGRRKCRVIIVDVTIGALPRRHSMRAG